MDYSSLTDWKKTLDFVLEDLRELDGEVDNGGIPPELVKFESLIADAILNIESALSEVQNLLPDTSKPMIAQIEITNEQLSALRQFAIDNQVSIIVTHHVTRPSA